MVPEVDLLAIDRGAVSAPAGCGKTQLIADALARHSAAKPILVLTHTNAGVIALRARLDKLSISRSAYRLSTIDGWAMRLISTFPMRSGHDPGILKLDDPRRDYPAIRQAASGLLEVGHLDDTLSATYDRLIVDEYQDCSMAQHAIVCHAARTLKVSVLGDPLQAIFGFAGKLAEWDRQVCTFFPLIGELSRPWRWVNAGTSDLGFWLLDVRRRLLAGQPIELASAPDNVSWIRLDGKSDHERRLEAGRTRAPTADGGVLIIAESTNPSAQRQLASQMPGAVTVESVELRDLVTFARDFAPKQSGAVAKIVEFAASVMTNVGGQELMRRVDSLRRGSAKNPPSKAEKAVLAFCEAPGHLRAVDLLVELNRRPGTRVHRPAVLAACIKMLRTCPDEEPSSLYDAAIRIREENRLLGRPLPKRAVGSTLLLKGLEADVAVVLCAEKLDKQNLYVAMTRGSRNLVICSTTSTLCPS